MTLPSGRAGTPQSLPCSAALGSLRATVLAGMAASAAAGLQGPGEAAVLSAKERLAAELPPPPSPTLDSEAIICLEAQRHLLQQQLTLLQQQLMAAPSQPPEARSGPAVEAAPRHVQAQHELHIAAGRSKEPPTEPIADCTAALLAALARRTQREEHWRQEHLQPAGIRGCQLASQPRQAWVAQAQYPVQQPASKAHRLAPQQAQRQAAEALPGWQQHRMECQNLLRQLKEEEEEAAAAAEEAEAEEEVEEEEEEEEEEELKSSASSSARGRRLTAQRTCSTERRLAVVAKLTLCPLSRRVMQDPVVAADGHTYERRNILAAFQRSTLSPITGQPMSSCHLKPNHSIRMLCRLVHSGP
ncbi:hypothetical protein CHLNCDRAFT_137696 [Chlorella variabilis]|uniref:U-box domain-containing protein n=1 Tax=Chlorella variabilis TaxID=554065 RepID=E1Z4A4_CHLVA|nr:hypothetical protein CHLNCDRAFT_137696 [Chlorella variabilis]EFN59018.1 hypothetical protein CHLNCDRAFT_137696 [Chlorella variabilis]|eukprot:XP_005851120.1 hypothetical protein CHLNCDRAFT_137696 [Chlorella variabilis]